MVSIRSIQPGQWRTYRDVRLRALQDTPDAFGSTYAAEVALPDERWAMRVAAASGSGPDKALFAWDGDEVCGLAWCKVSASEPGMADLFQMWVAPGSRRRGVGAALLREAVAHARQAGATTLRLGVTVSEFPAMGLYRSFGFRPVGSPEPLRDGTGLMAQTMHLDLDAAHRTVNPAARRTPMSLKATWYQDRLRKRVKKGFAGYPLATVAYYGPDNRLATKVAVGIMATDGGEVDVLERWTSESGDVRLDPDLLKQVLDFISRHNAKSVIATDGIFGCPHEEGKDYPEGETCPACPYWAHRDRFTGKLIG